jgi:hypothetical protein
MIDKKGRWLGLLICICLVFIFCLDGKQRTKETNVAVDQIYFQIDEIKKQQESMINSLNKIVPDITIDSVMVVTVKKNGKEIEKREYYTDGHFENVDSDGLHWRGGITRTGQTVWVKYHR